MPSKSDPVLVSPKGNEYVVTNPVTLHNLIAKGYRPKGKETVEAVVAKVTPSTGPEPSTGTDARPASSK